MGWISSLLVTRELNRLESLASDAPAPSVFLRLKELYEQQDQHQKAVQAARRGAELFPDHPGLGAASAEVKKQQRGSQKEILRSRVEEYPNPSIFARLASLHLEDDEIAECLRLCKRSLRHYPDYGGTYLVLAQVAVKEGDDDAAYDHLQKTMELDRFNYTGLMMLAEAHLRRGERAEAHECLQRILEFAPGDEKTESMLDNFEAIAEREESQQKSKTPTRQLSRKALSEAQAESLKGGEHVEHEDPFAQSVARLVQSEGVIGCVVIDRMGLVIASRFTGDYDEDLAAALAANILRASSEAAAPMGFAHFEEGILEANELRIHLTNLDDASIAVFARADSKSGLLQRAIHTFVHDVAQAS
jgi:predicted regulator of Ras-like GTPase activity (Roadblock/LC7/MglB family)